MTGEAGGSGTAQPAVALVVSTLGRVARLDQLFKSLGGQLDASDQLVVVAQGNFSEVRDLCRSWSGRLPISFTRSPRGLSVGRNRGVATLPHGEFILSFPNDSSWFPEGTIGAIRAEIRWPNAFTLGAVTVRDEFGPKRVLPVPHTALDKLNVWQVIEPGMLVSRAIFAEAGGFQESIGSGASTPWQSGEGTDLLLRAVGARPDLARAFRWMPPTIWVGGVSEGSGLTNKERRRKVRAYGRGMGHVAREHGYPLWWKMRALLGGAAIGLLHREQFDLLDGVPGAIGRLEGIMGFTISGGEARAVSR